MNERARELLESLRRADDPTDEDRARLRNKIGIGLGAGLAASAAAGGVAKAGTMTALKLLVPALVLVGAVAAYQATRPAPAPRAAAPRVARVAPPLAVPRPVPGVLPAAAVQPRVVAEAVPESEPEIVIEPALQAPQRSRAKGRVKQGEIVVTRAGTPLEPPTPADSLREELRLLRDAQARLSVGDARAAEQSLVEYHTRFPRGTLAPEAAAVGVRLACAQGDEPLARERAAAFVASFPDSPLRPRVERVCARGGLR